MTVTDLKEKLVDCNIAIGLGVVGLAYNHNWESVMGAFAPKHSSLKARNRGI